MPFILPSRRGHSCVAAVVACLAASFATTPLPVSADSSTSVASVAPVPSASGVL